MEEENSIVENISAPEGSSHNTQPLEGTASFNAADALKEYRENGNKPSGKTNIAKADKNQKRDEVENIPLSEKKDSEKESGPEIKDDNNSEAVDEESDSEETEESGPDGGQQAEDSDVEAENDDEVNDEDNVVKSIKDELEALKRQLSMKEDREKEEQYSKQIKADVERTKEPFKFDMKFDDLSNLLDGEALEYFNDDPIGSQYQLDLMGKAFNKFMSDYQSYTESQQRVQEYEGIQQREAQAKMVNELNEIGVDVKVFGSKQFEKYETDPKNQGKFNDYAKRFGEGSVEYARHVYDDYMRFSERSRKNTAGKVKAKASKAREDLGNKQAIADQVRPSGSSVPNVAPQTNLSPAQMLANYRKGK